MSHARDALRFVFKQRSLTTVVAAMLTLGIGGATAMFSAVQGVLLKPLPYERPGELVWMFGAFRQADSASVSPPDFLDYRTRQHVFRSLGAMVIAPTTVNVARPSGPERLSMATVSAGLLSTLGVSPLLGRQHAIAVVTRIQHVRGGIRTVRPEESSEQSEEVPWP